MLRLSFFLYLLVILVTIFVSVVAPLVVWQVFLAVLSILVYVFQIVLIAEEVFI